MADTNLFRLLFNFPGSIGILDGGNPLHHGGLPANFAESGKFGSSGGAIMSGSNFLSLLALDAPSVLRSDALVSELRRLRPGTTAEIQATGSANALVLAIGSNLLSIMTIDQPAPPGTFDRAIERGMLWPDAKSVLSKHKSHIVVGTMNAGTTTSERVAAADNLMWVSAAAASITPCLGVHWASAETVCPKDNFVTTFKLMTHDKLPLTIWMRLNLFAGTAQALPTIGCVTTGLATFVGREIEFEPISLPTETVVNLVLAIAQYSLSQGTVRHGETFGIGLTQRWQIEVAEKGRVIAAPVLHVSPAI